LKVSTKTWYIQPISLTTTRKCFFTPDGNFVFLTTSTQVYSYSMAEGTTTLFYTGQVNNIYFDESGSYALVALQNQRIDKVPMIIQDAKNCGPGKFSLAGGLVAESQCEVCTAGHLCPQGNSISPCVPGTYSFSTGLRNQGQCTMCPPGHFCQGATAFELCPLGSYSLATGLTKQAECTPCPAGFYCKNTTVLDVCPANTMSEPGSSDLGDCTCNPGYRCEVSTVVHAEVVLPITIVDFEALREQYIQAVALAAGVDPSQVITVSVVAAGSSRRRRLLALHRFTEIHTSIYNSKYNDKPHLALRTLQKHLAEKGLPPHQPDIHVTLHKEVLRATKAIAPIIEKPLM
jgi:hypothetical protein